MELAISAYIERVNHCSCGVIHLFKGAVESEPLKQLTMFLKGSKEGKEELKRNDPELYARFEMVWEVRKRHMVCGLPKQYIFLLICCFNSDCPHPICQKGTETVSVWFPDGPPTTQLHLPVVDPQQPWCNEQCKECDGFCTGHYLPDSLIDSRNEDSFKLASQSPSVVLKEKFKQLGDSEHTESVISDIAKSVLLSPHNVKIWFKHLQTVDQNRKRGAAKAAATRRQSKQAKSSSHSKPAQTHCGGNYGLIFEDDSETVEFWIGCDTCNKWFCCVCEGLSEPPNDEYVCSQSCDE